MFKLLNNLEMFTDLTTPTGAPACECPYNNCKCPVIDNKPNNIAKTIFGIIILIASVGMAIYRIKTHGDRNNGNYENELYIFGVIVISICCNMCYLPYALLYSFVFNKY